MYKDFKDKKLIDINNKKFYKIPIEEEFVKNNWYERKIINKLNEHDIGLRLNKNRKMKIIYYPLYKLDKKNIILIVNDYLIYILYIILHLFFFLNILNQNKKNDIYYLNEIKYDLTKNTDCFNFLRANNIESNEFRSCENVSLDKFKIKLNFNNAFYNGNEYFFIIQFSIFILKNLIYIINVILKNKKLKAKEIIKHILLSLILILKNILCILFLIIFLNTNDLIFVFYVYLGFSILFFITNIIIFCNFKNVDLSFYALENFFSVFFLITLPNLIDPKFLFDPSSAIYIFFVFLFIFILPYYFILILRFKFKKLEQIFRIFYIYIFLFVMSLSFFIILVIINLRSPINNSLTTIIFLIISSTLIILSFLTFTHFFTYWYKNYNKYLDKYPIVKNYINNQEVINFLFLIKYKKKENDLFIEIDNNDDIQNKEIIKENEDKKKEKILKINNEDNNNTNNEKCMICFNNKSNILLKPCNHANICSYCMLINWSNQNKCHLCNKNIGNFLEIEEKDSIYTVKYFYIKIN